MPRRASTRQGLVRSHPHSQRLFLHMLGDQLGHLKHADLLLAIEHRLQILVRIDEGLLFWILQSILADIGPKLFRQLGSWKGLVADNFGELGVRRNRFHECCIRCPLCLL